MRIANIINDNDKSIFDNTTNPARENIKCNVGIPFKQAIEELLGESIGFPESY